MECFTKSYFVVCFVGEPDFADNLHVADKFSRRFSAVHERSRVPDRSCHDFDRNSCLRHNGSVEGKATVIQDLYQLVFVVFELKFCKSSKILSTILYACHLCIYCIVMHLLMHYSLTKLPQ